MGNFQSYDIYKLQSKKNPTTDCSIFYQNCWICSFFVFFFVFNAEKEFSEKIPPPFMSQRNDFLCFFQVKDKHKAAISIFQVHFHFLKIITYIISLSTISNHNNSRSAEPETHTQSDTGFINIKQKKNSYKPLFHEANKNYETIK